MAQKKYTDKLIQEAEIKEEIRKIEGSKREYISPSGNIYTKYTNGYLKKKTFENKYNGYLYVGYIAEDGKSIQRRVHRLVAETYIPNPNNYPVVMHLDNNKKNSSVENLKWATNQENTKAAFDDGLAVNDKGFENSQSIPIVVLDLNGFYIKEYGSVSIAAIETGMTKTGILYQCNHKMTTKPRKGFYFRYLSEYEKYGFIL